jgi:hypothetical protein
MRFIISVLLMLLIVTGPRAQGDDPKRDQPEPPVRLKKKTKPDQDSDKDKKLKDEKKSDPAKEDKIKKEKGGDEPVPAEADEDSKLIIGRVSKNVDSSKDRLAQKDPGDGTQQIQRDIVKDLDALIEQSKRQQEQQQQQQQQGGQGSNSRQRSGQQKTGQQSSQRRNAGQQKQQASGQNQNQAGQTQQQASGQNPGGGGPGGKKSAIPNADLYKDIWGHLPELARMNLDAYSRVEFMSKYNDLLKQYYSTIAEKGRKKGDGQ